MVDTPDGKQHEDASPLSHPVTVTALSAKGRHVPIVATADELVALAKVCGLISVERLSAAFQVAKGAGPLLAVRGSLEADVVQTCGVSLKPVSEHVETDIVQTFTLEPAAPSSEIDINVDDEDPPETVDDGQIDFGALAFEHFTLNLNPYPRAPDAMFAAGEDENSDEGPEPHRLRTRFLC